MGLRYSRGSRLTPEEQENAFPLVTELVRDLVVPSTVQPSAVSDIILFIWTKTHSRLYQKLSFNIIREASSYLETYPELLILLNKDLVLFDLSSHRRQKLFSVEEEMLSLHSLGFLVLGHKMILVCGNPSDNPGKTQTLSYLLDRDGTVRQKSTLVVGRTVPGMIYDPVTDAVYAFGGLEVNTLKLLKHCEKLDFYSSHWQALPDMNRGRCEFLPCSHSSLIYLCGGGLNSAVETYSSLSNTFTLFPEFSLEDDDSPCLSVIEDDTLVVISKCHMYKWSLSRKEITFSLEVSERTNYYYLMWSICSPVVWQGYIYVAQQEIAPKQKLVCRGINLANGSSKEIVLGQD